MKELSMGPTMILNDTSWSNEQVYQPFTVFNNNKEDYPITMIRDELNEFCMAAFNSEELKIFNNHYQLVKSLMRSLVFETSFYNNKEQSYSEQLQVQYRQAEELNLAINMAIKNLDLSNKMRLFVAHKMQLRSEQAIEFWSLVAFSKLLYPMFLEVANGYTQCTGQTIDAGCYRQLLLKSISTNFPVSCATISRRTITNAEYKAEHTHNSQSEIYEYFMNFLFCKGLPSLRLDPFHYKDAHHIEELVDYINMSTT